MTDSVSARNERFREIFGRYKNRTYDFALRMLGDRETAGDVVQEVYMRLYKALESNPNFSDVQSWLFILTRNLCLNIIRDSAKEVSLDRTFTEMQVDADFADSGLRKVKRAMAALDPKYREALILKEYQGFSYQDIAGVLGITVPAVRSLLYKARLSLKENFEKLSIKRWSP